MVAIQTTFSDWASYQDASIWGDENTFVVNSQLRNRSTWGLIQRGRNLQAMCQGGTQIEHFHLDATQQTAENYNPGKPGKPKMLNVTSKVTFPWRHWRDISIAWQDEIISKNTSNAGDGFQTKAYRKEAEKIRLRAEAATQERMELSLHRRPNKSLMEDGDGDQLEYSIYAYLNEHPNGLIPAAFDANGQAWTTIATKNPTLAKDAHYKPTQVGFSNTTFGAPGNLLESMGSALRRAGWQTMDFFSLHREGSMIAPNVNEQGKIDMNVMDDREFAGILTDDLGIRQFERIAATGKDEWQNPNDPQQKYHFNGIAIIYAAAMDDIDFWPTLGTAVSPLPGKNTETAAGAAGARFLFIRNFHMMYVFETGWLNKMEGPIAHPNNPTGKAVWRFFSGNLTVDARKFLAIVYPIANTV